MTNDKPGWEPDLDDEAVKDLIRQTIKSAGGEDPSALPSKVRDRIKGRARGDLDIDAYVKEILRETGKR